MTLSVGMSVAIIAVVAVFTLITRALPFLVFGKGTPPKAVMYIGENLPSAVMALLVIYCLGSDSPDLETLLPRVIAGVTVAVLHIWKRNNLLSIAVGTLLYMFLLQRM